MHLRFLSIVSIFTTAFGTALPRFHDALPKGNLNATLPTGFSDCSETGALFRLDRLALNSNTETYRSNDSIQFVLDGKILETGILPTAKIIVRTFWGVAPVSFEMYTLYGILEQSQNQHLSYEFPLQKGMVIQGLEVRSEIPRIPYKMTIRLIVKAVLEARNIFCFEGKLKLRP